MGQVAESADGQEKRYFPPLPKSATSSTHGVQEVFQPVELFQSRVSG